MGAWGAGILQDDSAMDIIDDYRILLGYKVPREEAYKLIKDYYYPDFKGSDDEDIFWFALAIYQLRNGILEDEVKENAFKFLENPPSMDVWKESGKNIYQNRLKVLSKLKEELLNPSVTEPKKIPKPPLYYRFKTKFKEGDLIVCEVHNEDITKENKEYIGKYFLMRVIEVYTSPITKIKPELDFSLDATVAAYTWVSDKIPELKDLKNIELESGCIEYDLIEDEESEKYMHVIGNDNNYRKGDGLMGGIGGYYPLVWDIYRQIQEARENGRKFEVLGD